jgi:chromosome segregation ATPase
VKDASHTVVIASAEDNKPSAIERSSSNQSRELVEAQEKMRELEFELERLAGTLKHSESENSQLKDDVSLTKEKLAESGKKYEELELSHKKLQEHIMEADEKYSVQLNTLQAQEAKTMELTEVKEAFDGLSLELESSGKRIKEELEDELQCSAGELEKFEDLHKQSGSHAELETKKALEFERLLEVAKLSAKEVEHQMASLQELKGLCDKIAENQKVEEALKTTATELSAIQEELLLSRGIG